MTRALSDSESVHGADSRQELQPQPTYSFLVIVVLTVEVEFIIV